MDAQRFDILARSLIATPSRRGISRALAGLTLGGMLIPLLGTNYGDAKKKRKKNCKKPCGACQSCRKGKCKTQPDEAVCGNDGRCRSGVCIARPTCQPSNSYDCYGQADCCSNICVPLTGYPGVCLTGGDGRPCYGDDDCDEGLTCVAYVCRG
jgi:hypothetical protein